MPDNERKRTLDDRERLLYAPFSGVGGIVYDKDAVYIELGGSHSFHRPQSEGQKSFFDSIISSKKTIDSKLMESKLKLFANDELQIDTDPIENDETIGKINHSVFRK